jgi:hypothetical protein
MKIYRPKVAESVQDSINVRGRRCDVVRSHRPLAKNLIFDTETQLCFANLGPLLFKPYRRHLHSGAQLLGE